MNYVLLADTLGPIMTSSSILTNKILCGLL